MSTAHSYTSTCNLCGSGESRNTVIYGDYDGDEGDGATHEPENCTACKVLRANANGVFKIALKHYKEKRSIVKKLEKKHQKEIKDKYISLGMIGHYLRNYSELTPVKLGKRLEELVAIAKKSKATPRVEDDIWILRVLLKEVREDLQHALSYESLKKARQRTKKRMGML